MRLLIIVLSAVFTASDARVTFANSEVLQVNDLVNAAAAFNCPNGCKVYVDRIDDALYVSQNGQFIATFTDIVGNNSYVPDGIELPAGPNYKLQTRSTPVADFVFYVVSRRAPNYGVPVFAPQEKVGVAAVTPGRYFTVLSRFSNVEYSSFSGTFPTGYPKIYATGYDIVGDARCSPVYQARSQYNAEQSRPMIFAPITTVDFGYTGNVTVAQKSGKNPTKTAVSSTVYMSPGYVGCSNVLQLYASNVKSVQDSFSNLVANSLDISAVYTSVSAAEPVRFRVNKDTLDFFGTSSWARKYGSGSLDVALSWTRQTAGAAWAMQLDFGTGNEGWGQSSSPRPPAMTTSSGNTITLLVASLVVICLASVQ